MPEQRDADYALDAMEWVIHIGTQKTGSQAIQRFLINEIDRILGCTLCFPASGRRGIWHRPIYEELLDGRADALRAAREEASEHGADLGILSFAAFYTLAEAQIEMMHSVLGAVRIIMFLRRQDQLTNSMYNQLFKAHRVDYQQIVDYEASMLQYNPDYDHHKTLQKWSAVFGPYNIKPIIYDKRKSSIAQLLDRIGVAADFSNFEAPNPNPALDAQSLSLFRALKLQHDDADTLPALMNAAHRTLRKRFVDTYAEGDQYLLTLAERETICGHYAVSNEALRRVFFRERAFLFSPLEPSEVCSIDLPVDQALVDTIFEEAGLSRSGSP